MLKDATGKNQPNEIKLHNEKRRKLNKCWIDIHLFYNFPLVKTLNDNILIELMARKIWNYILKPSFLW